MRLPIFLVLAFAATLQAQDRDRLEFTRMVAHLAGYGEPGYIEFIDEVEPDLVQFGCYGAHFWSIAHTPQFGGYPARFPLQGLAECGAWFEERNKAMRDRDILVVGHFNVEFLVGDPDGPDGPRGFFKFYEDLWNEDELGPKPVEDPLDFLEKDKEGNPIVQHAYKIGGMAEYWACLRNPNWQEVLKRWMKRGIERGLDGAIANYFYRHDCHCEHCQAGFRAHLTEKYSPRQLKSKFKIEDLEAHVFDEIVCWHKPEESTPLRLEMLQWSQISNKQVFDEIFIKYARSLKPDFIVAQWNHLGNFNQIRGDERCLLPADLWGANEDYAWYSMGGAGHYSDLEKEYYGEGTLQARFLRGALDDKPFTLGKYEGVRTRVAIAELGANGGAPMGLYSRYNKPDARAVLIQYHQFMKRYDALFRTATPHAEVRLLFPRKEVHKGNIEPVQTFQDTGKNWLDRHILFSVAPDDLVRGGGAGYYDNLPEELDAQLSKFDAPIRVRVSANRPAGGGEIDLHFVNYNRDEPPRLKDGKPGLGKGTEDEKPIAVSGVKADFAIPPNFKLGSVEFITPEVDEPQALKFENKNGRVKFEVPEFLVYGIVRLIAKKEEPLKVAGVTTVYRHNSHADVFFSRMTETDTLDGHGDRPPLTLTSLFTDQVPESDISRSMAEKHGFSIEPSIKEALTHGGDKLAIDAVFMVAEHGEYPETDTGQTAYPKRRMFEAITDVFEETGEVVPVFTDKHLADNWEDAKWIYDKARELEIPLMAGSSAPNAWRYPAVDLKRDAEVKELVAVNYGGLDHYGFHAMEVVQSLVERRKGGETGVSWVQTLSGEAVWETEKDGLWSRQLLERVVDGFWTRPMKEGKTIDTALRGEPTLFHVQYEDGLKVSVLTLPGVVAEWGAAWRYGDDSVDSTSIALQEIRPFYHFALLISEITKMMQTGKPQWPIERTLMTSGVLNAAMKSRSEDGRKIETPYLEELEYKSDWNWTQPPLPPPGRSIRGR
ncbi:MAG: hypothetical protein ACI8UO_005443 [Verrucomicrobiales bacterium]|jgi:hypothetical protein